MTRLTATEYAATLRNNPDLAHDDEPRQGEPGRARSYRLPHPPTPTEEQEQIALFTWATLAVAVGDYPDLALLYHIPNGGLRDKATAQALKRAGVRAGVPDLHLPVARHGFYGLWIELKRANRSNHPTPDQEWWIEQLRVQGYRVEVCYGADEAIQIVEEYLGEE